MELIIYIYIYIYIVPAPQFLISTRNSSFRQFIMSFLNLSWFTELLKSMHQFRSWRRFLFRKDSTIISSMASTPMIGFKCLRNDTLRSLSCTYCSPVIPAVNDSMMYLVSYLLSAVVLLIDLFLSRILRIYWILWSWVLGLSVWLRDWVSSGISSGVNLIRCYTNESVGFECFRENVSSHVYSSESLYSI